jgi:hypothetical protein
MQTLPASLMPSIPKLFVSCVFFAWLGRAKPYRYSVFGFVKIKFLFKQATKI